MEKSIKKWGQEAGFTPPAKRSAKLEHNPVTTCFTLTNFGVPTRTIRRIYRVEIRNHYISSDAGF